MAAAIAMLMIRLRAWANLVVFISVPSFENLGLLLLLTLTYGGRGAAALTRDPTGRMKCF